MFLGALLAKADALLHKLCADAVACRAFERFVLGHLHYNDEQYISQTPRKTYRMPADFVSLCNIVLAAAICPILAKLIPHKLIPETVLLLLAGTLMGPYAMGVIKLTESVNLLSDLGLAFLFLLAGYEIRPKSLAGTQGKRGLFTWIISFALAFLLMHLIPNLRSNPFELIAMAIVFTTTALGTLMPILKERELLSTRIGESILAYGTWGEVCPIVAMTILLSSRAEWKTALILMMFTLLCILTAVVPAAAKKAGHRMFRFLNDNAETTSQTVMRTVVLLLVGLITLSVVFNLDIVLGAFAAGFVLRYIVPEGNRKLELKLDGVAYGFLIPVFFVVSGTKINLMAVFNNPTILIGFIIMLLLLRACPIFVALSTGKDTRDISTHNRLSIALYCTTALPIIVAVTVVAVGANAMSSDMASVLVAAGALTVFLMPLLASVTYRVADVKPLRAVQKISQHPKDIGSIVHDHLELERLLARQRAMAHLAEKQHKENSLNLPWEDVAFHLQHISERKRALDKALDTAAQKIAAHYASLGNASLPDIKDWAELSCKVPDDTCSEREIRRRHLAEIALYEYYRRLAEIGRMPDELQDFFKGEQPHEKEQPREGEQPHEDRLSQD